MAVLTYLWILASVVFLSADDKSEILLLDNPEYSESSSSVLTDEPQEAEAKEGLSKEDSALDSNEIPKRDKDINEKDSISLYDHKESDGSAHETLNDDHVSLEVTGKCLGDDCPGDEFSVDMETNEDSDEKQDDHAGEAIPAAIDEPSSNEDVKLAEPEETLQPSGEPEHLGPPSTTTEAPDPVISGVHENDMPSFDEWKKQRLAEQAEEEKAKLSEANMQQTNGNGVIKKSSSSSKNRVNYASMSCGAKLLATNPEAKNPSSVLTEIIDHYMIQPCVAKKWFAVELCEPVQIQSMEMGNLELFSSLPESFVVHISDRYPSKEWKAIGMFHARDERSIQSFSVEGMDLYAKYLKVEMITHYGSEHYCPLTTLRVFGTTVEEDDEDAEHQEGSPNVVDDLDLEASLDDDSTQTFAERVIDLVKTVLNGDEPKRDQQIPETAIHMNGTTENKTSKSSGDSVSLGQSEPCTPDANSNQAITNDGKVEGQPLPRTPVPDVQKSSAKIGDDADRIPKLVTLIETPDISIKTLLASCNFCDTGLKHCLFSHSGICGYYRALVFVPGTSCVDYKGKTDTMLGTSTLLADPQATENSQNIAEMDPSSSDDVGVPTSLEVIHSSESVDLMVSSSASATPEMEKSDVTPGQTSSIVVNEELIMSQTILKESETNASRLDLKEETDSSLDSTSSDQLGPNTESLQPTPSSSELQDAITITEDAQVVSSDADYQDGIQPTEVPEEMAGSSSDLSDPDHSASPPDEEAMSTLQLVLKSNNNNNIGKEEMPDQSAQTSKIIYAEDTQIDELDPESGALTPDEHPDTIQKLSADKKVTTVMRLKNRIKSLELNLNLSSRYLEELSQRYKRQMEEMYQSLNKTIAKLSNTAKSAEERDQKQQKHIAMLQQDLKTAKSEIDSLNGRMEDVLRQVVEGHLFLMVLEITVFVAIMTYCFKLQKNKLGRSLAQNGHVENIGHAVKKRTEGTHAKVLRTPSRDANRERRNSVGYTPSRYSESLSPRTPGRTVDDIGLRWSAKNNSMTVIEPDISIFQPRNKSGSMGALGKKKKKKQSRKISAHNLNNSCNTVISLPHSESLGRKTVDDTVLTLPSSSFPKQASPAGVLFGQDKKRTKASTAANGHSMKSRGYSPPHSKNSGKSDSKKSITSNKCAVSLKNLFDKIPAGVN